MTGRSRTAGASRRKGLSGTSQMAAAILTALVLVSGTRPEERPTPAAPLGEMVNGRYDYAGLIHVHTAWSDDASGSYDSLAREAGRQGIRFLIVTDHNTLGPGVAKDRWRHGVLTMTGLESSRPEGHLLAFGMAAAPLEPHSPTGGFVEAVAEQGGTIALAHPTHPRWAWEGPVDGRIGAMEIVDLADQFHEAPTAAKVSTLGLLPFVGRNAYLRLAGRPAAALALWDGIGARRRMTGFYAPDIHQSIEVSDRLRVPFPPARDIMRLGRNHILTPTPMTGDAAGDRALVLGAVARGRLYVSFDIIGDGRGFGFSGVADDRTLEMGDEHPAGGPVAFNIVAPEAARALGAQIRLLRDGVVIASGAPGVTNLSHADGRPGVYRVEVMVPPGAVPQAPGEMVWIYSNPIYLRAPRRSN